MRPAPADARHTQPSRMAEHYGEREVIWLLSIDHETALDIDSEPGSSFPDLLSSNFSTGSTGTSDEQPLLTVLRWDDVHAGRARMAALIDEEVLELRLEGLTQHQIAVVLERSQHSVKEAFKGTVALVLQSIDPD